MIIICKGDDIMGKHSKDSVKAKPTKKQIQQRISIAFCAVLMVLSIVTIAVLLYLDVLPVLYLGLVVILLLGILLFCIYSQMKNKIRLAGRIVAGIMCVVLLFSDFHLLKITSLLGNITDIDYTVETVAVAVLKEDPAQTLEDVKNYKMGICDTLDRENVDTAIEKWNKKLKTELNTTEYDGILHLVEALFDKKIGAIIYNPIHNDMVNEDIEGFSDDIRIIDTIEIKVKNEDTLNATHVDVTKDPFAIYISGIDTYGSIKARSRSDVNIVAFVNPTSKQIMLLTTSRDGYVDIPGVTKNLKDKLTHAGIYGVEKSIATLEQIYDTKINYFVRVNFTSVLKIVDALGGIDIYCPFTFTSVEGIRFEKGNNHFNGKQALAFARERHAFSGGDNQRGKNQQLVIKAMLTKMMSKSILKGYSSILSTVSSNMQTNMTTDQITDIVKMQLSDGSDWAIKSLAVDGKGAKKCCYSYSATKPLYVCMLSDEKIAEAKADIAKIMNGEMLEGADVLSESNANLGNTKDPEYIWNVGKNNNSSSKPQSTQSKPSETVTSSETATSSDKQTSSSDIESNTSTSSQGPSSSEEGASSSSNVSTSSKPTSGTSSDNEDNKTETSSSKPAQSSSKPTESEPEENNN